MRGYLYFAYGSNMKIEQMRSRAGIINFIPAKLHGYELAFNKQAKRNPKEGYANVMPKDGGVVEGILYELDDLTQLDKNEGVPTHYNKKIMEVVTDNGDKVKAFVYVANSGKVVDGLLPTKEYVGRLLENKLLSEDYADTIREQPVLMTETEELLESIAWFLGEFEPGKVWHEKHFEKAKRLLTKHNYGQR